MRENFLRRVSLLVLSMILMGAGLTRLQGAIINIDFNAYSASTNSFPGGVENYTGQGAVSDPGNNGWNYFLINGLATPATLTDLTTSTGAGTGISLTVNAASAYNEGYSNDLFQEYIIAAGGGSSWTLQNLTPGQSYDLYFYSQPAQYSGSASFTVGANTVNVNSVSNNTGFNLGTSYNTLTAVADGTGQITGSYTGNWNGLTIATIPEPGTYVLLAAGLVGVFVLRRRLKATAA
ncbi:MAG: PEP-CTERM sorting domain-containing protein [Candidatus Methylacidiphilales bacterium]|nr:PEP-CTERM sorting domain-containing protein [Candidatus Methylacidiphilales bacterium]